MKRFASALVFAFASLSNPGLAGAIPTIIYSGSIEGTDPVLIPEITEFAWQFLSSFDNGTADSTSISGFTSIADETTAPGAGSASFTLTDAELDVTATVRTGNSIDTFYGDHDGGPLVLDFGEGLIGTNFQSVSRSAIGPTEVITERFDGSFTLATTGSTTALGLQLFNEIDSVTGGSGAPLVAFTGALTGSSFDGIDTTTIFFDTTLVPVADVETVASGANVDTALLGGTGEIGGVVIEFVDAGSGGQLTASFEGLDVAAVDAIIADPSSTPADLGIFFGGGEAQVWDIEFSGEMIGPTVLTLSYDDQLFGPSFDETVLAVVHKKDDGEIEIFNPEDVVIDVVANTITLTVDSFSPFFLAVPEPSSVLLVCLGLAYLGRRANA